MHPSSELSHFIWRLVARSLAIRAVWTIGLEEGEEIRVPQHRAHELLAFADRSTLQHLRKSADLQRDDLTILVVVDGDVCEQVWGERKACGSLARWAWRQVSPHIAYYDQSRWVEGAAGGVTRVRRKAILVWQSARPGNG